jgi:hypothetical protein
MTLLQRVDHPSGGLPTHTDTDCAGAVGVKLDDETFVTAARLIDAFRAERSSGFMCAARCVFAERRAWLTSARLLLHFPRLALPLTTSPQGKIIAGRLRSRDHGIRTHALAQGVLAVPTDPTAYLRGRNRQALRNKLSKAKRCGISTVLESAEAGLLADKEIYTRRIGEGTPASDQWPVPANLATWFVASGPDGAPIAVLGVIQDRHVALLKVLHAVPDGELRSPARHALHQALVTHLSAAGVQYLVGDSALRAIPGIRQFMHELGYAAWHLRPVAVDATTGPALPAAVDACARIPPAP